MQKQQQKTKAEAKALTTESTEYKEEAKRVYRKEKRLVLCFILAFGFWHLTLPHGFCHLDFDIWHCPLGFVIWILTFGITHWVLAFGF